MNGDIRTLYVEDDPDIADSAAKLLSRADSDITVETAYSASEGLEILRQQQFDCVVSDYDMSEMDGLEFLREIRTEYPDLPFLILTGKGSETIASEAISAGATDYLRKRVGNDQYTLLANRIKTYAKQRRAKQRQKRRIEAIETAREGISILSEDGEFVYLNEAYADLYGYEQEELVGEHWEILYTDSGAEFAREEIIPKVEETGYWHGESTGMRADGSTFPADHVVSATESGELVCTIRDKTQEEQRKRQLEWENRRYRALFEHTNDAVAWTEFEDDSPIIREANPAFRDRFEKESQEVIGQQLGRVVTSPDESETEQTVAQRAMDGEHVSDELTRETTDGPREFLAEAIPLTDTESGAVEYIHAVYTDITEQRKRQEELQAQNERLEQFRRVISHDLRNPLNVAVTRLELAQQEFESDDLDAIARSLDRMERLIDDLLLIAKGNDEVSDPSIMELRTAARDSWENVNTAEATIDIDPDIVIRADRNRVQQLLENLFRNAIEHGGDTVTVTVGPVEDGFYVADDGEGIPESEREDVFESGYSTTHDGTGFGLSIVSQVADVHDWEITLTASSSGGARFEFTGVDRER